MKLKTIARRASSTVRARRHGASRHTKAARPAGTAAPVRYYSLLLPPDHTARRR